MSRKEITVFISANYTPNSIRFSLPLKLARLLFVGVCTALLAVLIAGGLLISGVYRFSRLVYLNHRNRQLEEEFKKVVTLKERLELLEKEREKLARMLGVNLTPPPVDWSAATVESIVLPEWVKNQPWGSHPVPVLVPVTRYAISRTATTDHMAFDLACQKNSPVLAVADGIVTEKGVHPQFGRYLLIRHAQGYESYYGHLAGWLVEKGDTVRVGQKIGTVGMTGQASAPHLHLEIRKDGNLIDPAALLNF